MFKIDKKLSSKYDRKIESLNNEIKKEQMNSNIKTMPIKTNSINQNKIKNGYELFNNATKNNILKNNSTIAKINQQRKEQMENFVGPIKKTVAPVPTSGNKKIDKIATDFTMNLIQNKLSSSKGKDNKSDTSIIRDSVKDTAKNAVKEIANDTYKKVNRATAGIGIGGITEFAKPVKVFVDNFKEDSMAREKALDEMGITNPIQRALYNVGDSAIDIGADTVNVGLNAINNISGKNFRLNGGGILEQDQYRKRTEDEVAQETNRLQDEAIKMYGGVTDDGKVTNWKQAGQLYSSILQLLSAKTVGLNNPTTMFATTGAVQNYGNEGTTESAVTGGVKGAITGKIFKTLSPFTQNLSNKALTGMGIDTSAVANYVSNIIGTGGKYGISNAFSQVGDILKLDPNSQYIDYNDIQDRINKGELKTEEDIQKAISWQITYNRASEVGWSTVQGMAMESALGWNTAKATAYQNKLNNSLDKMSMEKIYKTLGINKNTTFEEAKAQYRKLAKLNHPDITKDSGETMQKINVAYDNLLKTKGWTNPILNSNISTNVNSNSNIVPINNQQFNNGIIAGISAANNVNTHGLLPQMQQKTPQTLQTQGVDNTTNINAPKIGLNEQGNINTSLENERNIQTDNQGRQLAKQQQEYFKDSKVRDEKGNLEIVYHSTPNEFTVFDSNKLGENTAYDNTAFGTFVTSNKSFSERFKDIDNKGINGKTMELYANVTNPIIHPYKAGLKYDAKQADKIVEDYLKAIDEIDGLNQLQEMVEEGESDSLYDAYIEMIVFENPFEYAVDEKEKIISKGYDAIEIIEGLESELLEGSNNDTPISSYAIFNSNQLKNVDNTNPTENPDIRDSNPTTEWSKYLKENWDLMPNSTKTLAYRNNFIENSNQSSFSMSKTEQVPDTFSSEKPQKYYGEIIFLGNNGKPIETLYYLNKESFENEIKESTDIGRPIRAMKKDSNIDISQSYLLTGEFSLPKTSEIMQVPDLIKADETIKANQNKAVVDGANALNMKKAPDKIVEETPKKTQDEVSKTNTNKGITSKEFINLYKEKENAIKEYNKLYNDTLTDKEKEVVDYIERNKDFVNKKEIQEYIEKNRKSINKQNVINIVKTKSIADDLKTAVDSSKKTYIQKYKDIANEVTKNMKTWKDKAIPLQYAVNTPRRIIYDIIPDRKEAKQVYKTIFAPTIENNVKIIKEQNQIYDEINNKKTKQNKEYNITKYPKIVERIFSSYIKNNGYEKFLKKIEGKDIKVSENMLIQLYGNELIDDNQLEQIGADKIKIKETVELARKIYDKLFDEINDARIKIGYNPIPKRKNYFPQFTENGHEAFLDKMLSVFGIKQEESNLPTEIAGRTEDFKPNTKWFANLLERKTNITDYDFLEGIKRYVPTALQVIHHTDDIMLRRVFFNTIRRNLSDDAINERFEEILFSDAPFDEKQSLIESEFPVDKKQLSNFVTWGDEHINLLAGKKARSDRIWENNIFGRKIYNVFKGVDKRIINNMLSYNLSSALNNFFPLTRAITEVNPGAQLKTIGQMIINPLKKDGFKDNSPWMITRKGVKDLKTNKLSDVTKKINDNGYLVSTAIDLFASEYINRSIYNELSAINKKLPSDEKLTEQEILYEAYEFTANIIGDRSQGQTANIYSSQNPVVKTLSRFTLEPVNDIQHTIKDIILNKDMKAYKKIIAIVGSTILAHLFSDAKEKITGRRMQKDIIYIVEKYASDYDEFGAEKAYTNLLKNIVGEIPFVNNVFALFGVDGGRLPIANAIPNFTKITSDMIKYFASETDDEDSAKEDLKETGIEEFEKMLYYLIAPTGGGQIKKGIQAGKVLKEGGDYNKTSKGEKLRFPTGFDTMSKGEQIARTAQALTFGKYALPNGQKYVDSGFKALSEKKTEQYREAMDLGIKSDDFYNFANAISNIKSDKDENGDAIRYSVQIKKKESIDNLNMNLTDEQMKKIYEFAEINYDAKKFIETQDIIKEVGQEDFYKAYNATREIEVDKNRYGKTIAGSKSKKIKKAINDALPANYDYYKKKKLYKYFGGD